MEKSDRNLALLLYTLTRKRGVVHRSRIQGLITACTLHKNIDKSGDF